MVNNKQFNQVTEDIAIIKTLFTSLDSNFQDFKTDTKKFCSEADTRINTVENRAIATDQKVSNLAVFQSIFSIIIGTIAAFLGIKKD